MNVEDIFSMFGFDDFFGDLFGTEAEEVPGGPARGYDLETSVELTLNDVAHRHRKNN